ncbi:NAD kinase [Massilibacterium senegalense]|uniref:NAD kinase n=1 Tax=Massilibacterium senegalense TaxID=1632858 RepID=UPI000784F4F4|nr:NAD kinase [Massilibacterium senegalense]
MTDRKNLFFFYKQDPYLMNKIEPLIELAKKYGFTIVNHHKDANIIASFGNDGSFLQSVRKTGFRDDCLYVGIGTKPQNFYCDFHLNDVEGLVEALQTEKVEVRKYRTIETTINNSSSFYSLNETSIRSSIIKTISMDVFIDDLHFETFRGDGLIISTPTGSMAYNKSVFGAVVDPLLPCMQVSELASLNNTKYRTLGSPFILSGERSLTLRIIPDGNNYPVIGFDNEALSFKQIEEINVRLQDRRIKTIKLKDNSFWQKVKRSFLS